MAIKVSCKTCGKASSDILIATTRRLSWISIICQMRGSFPNGNETLIAHQFHLFSGKRDYYRTVSDILFFGEFVRIVLKIFHFFLVPKVFCFQSSLESFDLSKSFRVSVSHRWNWFNLKQTPSWSGGVNQSIFYRSKLYNEFSSCLSLAT